MQTPTTRKRRQRRDTGTRLTDRDLLALKIIGEQYALTFDQLQSLLGHHAKGETLQTGILSDSATRHAIDRWEAANLAEYKKILVDMSGFCWLTTDGLHAVDLPFRKYRPAPSQLNHIYWSAQARLWLAFKYPLWNWQSERWLRASVDRKIKSVKHPDALITLPDQRTIAVEIELTMKDPTTLEEVIRDRTLVYGQTWYFTFPQMIDTLNSAIHQIDSNYQQRVKVYSLDILTGK